MKLKLYYRVVESWKLYQRWPDNTTQTNITADAPSEPLNLNVKVICAIMLRGGQIFKFDSVWLDNVTTKIDSAETDTAIFQSLNGLIEHCKDHLKLEEIATRLKTELQNLQIFGRVNRSSPEFYPNLESIPEGDENTYVCNAVVNLTERHDIFVEHTPEAIPEMYHPYEELLRRRGELEERTAACLNSQLMKLVVQQIRLNTEYYSSFEAEREEDK